MKKIAYPTFGLALLMLVSACSTSTKQAKTQKDPMNKVLSDASLVLKGVASWYGHPFHGRTTANGEKYNMYDYTAAHKTLPFGSRLLVINPKNNKSLMVRVNDRGPYVGNRILDLSFAAARELELLGTGTGQVTIAVYPPLDKMANISAMAGYTKSTTQPKTGQLGQSTVHAASLVKPAKPSILVDI